MNKIKNIPPKMQKRLNKIDSDMDHVLDQIAIDSQ